MTITFGNTPADNLDVYPILSADDLLNDEGISHVLKDIQKHLVVPNDVFVNIYLSIINNYAEYIQALPSSKYKNFQMPKGQLYLALLRASITLAMADNFACPATEQKLTTLQLEQRMAIWQFAVFSSALLLDIGPALAKFKVFTCKQDATNLSPWHALFDSMTKNAEGNTCYTYQNIDELVKNPGKNLTLLVASKIIPAQIFSWLRSEADIFVQWLDILDSGEEQSDSGTLAKLTYASLNKLLELYINAQLPPNLLKLIPYHILQKTEYHKSSFWRGLDKKKQEQADENPNTAGTEFLEWLKAGLIDQSIPINTKTSNVHISTQGVFLINPEIFLDFCKFTQKYQNWLTVFKQFINLGITSFKDNNELHQEYFPNLEPPQTKRGLIINDPKYIFGNSAVPGVSTHLAPNQANQKYVSIFPNFSQVNSNLAPSNPTNSNNPRSSK